MDSFHRLQRRELKGKLPNSMRDYHLQAFAVEDRVTDLVLADDIICVFCSLGFRNAYLIPFVRAEKISPLTDDCGKPLKLKYPMDIKFVYYNSNNNSVITVGYDEYLPIQRIISVDIASIKAGETNGYIEIFAGESDMSSWDFDIPNCRGMIYNAMEKVLKFFDLKEYNLMFIIPVERETNWNFESRGNIYLMKYLDGNFPNLNKLTLKAYSKLDGQVCGKEANINLHSFAEFYFATLCGNNTICMRGHGLGMEIADISGDIPEIIQTNIETTMEPYYLDKLDRLLCYTTRGRLHVCNLRGDILNTFEDHNMRMDCLTERQFHGHTYITSGQDMVISVCGSHDSASHCTINISSIITGECLAKITTQNGSQIREAALANRIISLAYDERTGEIFTANENGICCVWSNRFLFDDRQLPGIPAEDMRG